MTTLIRPGSNVRVSAADARGGDPTATDTAFLAVITERGSITEPTEIVDLAGHLDAMGDRAGYTLAHDSVWALLQLGVSRIVEVRVVGAGNATASSTLQDATPADSLTVSAASPGEWGNRLSREVIVGSAPELRTLIIRLDDIEVERFIDKASATEFVTAMASSTWVRGTDEGGDVPAVAADANLAGGLADEDGITLTEVAAALALADADYGRGQVLAPGWTTTAAKQMLLDHAAATDRVAYFDSALTETFSDAVASTWAAEVAAVEEYAVDGVDVSRLGGYFPQWWDLAPYAGTVARAVPGSVIAAGLTARSDRSGEGINVQPAFSAGTVPSNVATAAVPKVTDAQRSALYDDRVNLARQTRAAGLQLYGFQSVTADTRWRQLNWSRYAMSLSARVNIRADQQLGGADGRVTLATLQTFGSILSAELLADYEAGELYGATPADAYTVDVGPTVNTAETMADGQKRARIEPAMTPSGDTIVVDIVKRPITV